MQTPKLRIGDIYWLSNCPPLEGDRAKCRPVVIISPPTSDADGDQVVTVACTSTVLSRHTDAVELPSLATTPNARTGLPKRTWAIPQWLVPVDRRLLTDYSGHLGGGVLRRLLEAVAHVR